MKSVSLVQHTPRPRSEPDTLLEIARHFQIAWVTAVAQVEEHTFIASDAEGNLTLLQHNVDGVTAEDRQRLELVGEMYLGEMVNRIKGVDVDAGDGAVVVPRAFLATVSIPSLCVSSFGFHASRENGCCITFL